MSELLEQQEPTWLEAWQAPPAFLEITDARVCSDGSEPFYPLLFTMLGCAIGVVVMGAVCTSIMRGFLHSAETLNKLGEEPIAGDPPETVRRRP